MVRFTLAVVLAFAAAQAVDALTRRVDRLSEALGDFTPGRRADDIPVGLGYEPSPAPVEQTVWITPLDQAPDAGAAKPGGGGLLRGGAQPKAAVAQRADQRRHQTRARRADRVAQRAGAAVDVDAVLL